MCFFFERRAKHYKYEIKKIQDFSSMSSIKYAKIFAKNNKVNYNNMPLNKFRYRGSIYELNNDDKYMITGYYNTKMMK